MEGFVTTLQFSNFISSTPVPETLRSAGPFLQAHGIVLRGNLTFLYVGMRSDGTLTIQPTTLFSFGAGDTIDMTTIGASGSYIIS